jgi:hypothetical protein
LVLALVAIGWVGSVGLVTVTVAMPKEKDKEVAEPESRLSRVLKFLFHRPSSAPLESFHLRFSGFLLLLYPLALAYVSIADSITPISKHYPQKESDPFAFALVSHCPVSPSVFIPAVVTLLGLSFYQLNLKVISVFLLSFYPLADFATFSILHIPSYAVAMVVSVIGFLFVWESLSFRMGSYSWVFLTLFAHVLFAVGFLIRPEGIVWSGIAILLFYAEVVRAIIAPKKRISWKYAYRLCFYAAQQFTFAVPSVSLVMVARDRFGPTKIVMGASTFAQYRVEFQTGLEVIVSYLLFVGALGILTTVDREFRVMALIILLFLAAIAIVLVPFESSTDAVVGNLFTIKVVLLHATAVVFGKTRRKVGRLLVGLIGLTLSSTWFVGTRNSAT